MSKKKSFLKSFFPGKKINTEKKIEKAEKKAEKILDKALDKGEELIFDAQKYSHTLSSQVEALMKKLEASYLAVFEKELQKNLGELTQKLEREQLSTISTELKAYKETQMKHIDALVLEKVNQMAREVLGRSLLDREHEELVVAALKKAREQHVF